MGRIEHRQTRRGAVRAADGWRRLPRAGWVFVALAVVVGVVDLRPVADAFWLGATEWWGEVPMLLPVVARSCAMVLLPAAIAWGSPGRYRANRWLWKGALIIALVQVARYPVGLVGEAVVQGLVEGGVEQGDVQWLVVNVVFGFTLAFLSVLGVWALAEGVKDAGGGSLIATAVAVVLGLAVATLFLVPSVMAGLAVDLEVLTGLLSVAVNAVYVFAHALLAGRIVAGAARRLRPSRAWALGAGGGLVLVVAPVLSLAVQLLNFYVFPQGEGISLLQAFLMLPFFGWPVVAIALSMRMARFAAVAPNLVGTGFVMRGRPRHGLATPA